MKKTRLMAAMAVVIGGALMASVSVHAQTTPLEVWQPQQGEVDPAKRVPQTSQRAPNSEAASQPVASPQHYTAAPPASAVYQQNRGGFFIGAQAGKGWVYDDVDQSALMVNAGYRWQAGAVTLVGIEVAGGQLDGTTKYDYPFGSVDLLSVGVNARFNFGQSPVYALVRGGYWSADNEYGGSIDGGYAGVGLGVDFNRNFNMSVIYTNYVYFSDYTYDYEDISRADTLMLGAEIRF